MLTNVSKLQVQVGPKVFQFLCDMDSSLPDVKEALFQFQKYVGQIEDNIKAAQEQAAAEAKAKEQPTPELAKPPEEVEANGDK